MRRIVIFISLHCLLITKYLFSQEPKLMIPIGHSGMVESVSFSNDGQKIASASRDNTIKIWNGSDGKLLMTLEGHTDYINFVTFSPDGQQIATKSWDHSIKIWELKTGKLLHTFRSNDIITPPQYSKDGRTILFAADSALRIWDLITQKYLLNKRLKFLPTVVYYSYNSQKIIAVKNIKTDEEEVVTFSSKTGQQELVIPGSIPGRNSAFMDKKGNMVICQKGIAQVWNYENKKLITVLNTTQPAGSSNSSTSSNLEYAVFNNMADKIVASSDDKKIFFWDSHDFKLIKPTENDITGSSPKISPDDTKIITMFGTQMLVSDVKTGKKLTTIDLDLPATKLLDFKFAPDNKRIISSFNDGGILIFDVDNGKSITALGGHTHTSYTQPLILTPENVLITSVGNQIKVWDRATNKIIKNMEGSDDILLLEISQDHKKLLTMGLHPRKAKIWDLDSGTFDHYVDQGTVYAGNNSPELIKATFQPGQKRVLLIFKNRDPELWDLVEDTLMFTLEGHKGTINDGEFSKNGKLIITSSNDKTAKIWDAETGNLVKTFPGNLNAFSDGVETASFTEDGQKIITTTFKEVLIWSVISDSVIFQSGRESFMKPIFSPDGKRLFFFGKGYEEVMLDLTTLAPVFSTPRPGNESANLTDLCATFSPDGKMIALFHYATEDINSGKVAWVIDALTGKIKQTLRGHSLLVNSGVFTHDNKYIITGSYDHTFKKWDLSSGQLSFTFLAVDSSDFLITDKYGRYDGTKGAMNLLYFMCENEVIELNQLKDQLWIPNLAIRVDKHETINAKTLKELKICLLTPEVIELSNTTEFIFNIHPRLGGLGDIILFVNGIEVRKYQRGELTRTEGIYKLIVKNEDLENFFVAGKNNMVILKAYTADNGISSREVVVRVDRTTMTSVAPHLYAVMVGVSDYKGDELDLKYAAKDANDLSTVIANAAKKMIGDEYVFMYNLTTASDHYQLPEKNNIKKLLEDIGKKAMANDILLIFFAGHGVMEGEKKQFYFLTADASNNSATETPADVGISTVELIEWIKPQNIKAQKRILIFDACNSGQAINDIAGQDLTVRNDDKALQMKAIDKLNEKSGLFILSASASNQRAYESGRFSQGLMTYSLLKAIKQQPDILEDGKYLDVSRWFNAASRTVSDMSKQNGARQEPQIVSNTNFNIGQVDEEVIAKIILPQEKPLFASSNFQNSDEAADGDNLEISKIINQALNEISARGIESNITYITATNSPDAYTLSGRYDAKGNNITIRISIKKNNESKYKFEVKGTTDKIKDLAATVARIAAEWIALNN